jgi:Flavin containing amine oxidoreductase/NAD(P)-binding Rossmann-like domain
MSNKNKYDIIIIGGGIAGLYTAYKILKINPEKKVLLLEGHKKQWLGGRLGNEMFQGTQIVTGAGVGRKEKDHLLIKLLRELKVPYNEFQVVPNPANTISPPCNVKKLINILKKQFKETPSEKTFKEFVLPILGPELYKNLTTCLGYTDYENEDIRDTLYNYGLEDNFDSWTALHIPWKKLVETIAKKVGGKNIKCSSYVINIEKLSPCNFIVHTENGLSYLCSKVILATTISSVQKLLPKFSIYQQIHGQTFLRLYGKFSKSSAEIMKHYVHGYTIVPGVLKKIITMDADKGVYMIAYTDNKDAKYLKDRLENTPKNREYFCDLLEEALGIPKGVLQLIAIKDFYWPIGTHYYEPLHGPFKNRSDFIKKAQNPMPGILVVGEMISINQGWTQGALESVEAVVTKKWIDSNC